MSEPADDTVYVVMQARCLYCGAEHYAPMVSVISLGEAGCEACGRIPPVFHDDAAYRLARREVLAFRETSPLDVDTALVTNLLHWAKPARDEDEDDR